jgi:hypothetical protein
MRRADLLIKDFYFTKSSIKMKAVFFSLSMVCTCLTGFSQNKNLVFVHLSDTHIGSSTGADDFATHRG